MRQHLAVLVLVAAISACLASSVPQKPAIQATPQNPMPKADPKDFAIVVTGAGDEKDRKFHSTTSTQLSLQPQTPNNNQQIYPIGPAGNYYIRGSEYSIAGANELDPQRKNPDGIVQPDITFNIPDPTRHPMEDKTPLIDFKPCFDDRILGVDVISAKHTIGRAHATLPTQFGCGATDASREKASPAIKISNFNVSEVKDFSLQMISMGDAACAGPGSDTYNKIHWHVTGIKPSFKGDEHEFTLQEGASHDKRTLFGGQEQPNQWLEEYYGGPCPDYEATECFRFKVLGHLHDGSTCFCGHEDVLYERPAKPIPPVKSVYQPSTLAPVGKK